MKRCRKCWDLHGPGSSQFLFMALGSARPGPESCFFLKSRAGLSHYSFRAVTGHTFFQKDQTWFKLFFPSESRQISILLVFTCQNIQFRFWASPYENHCPGVRRPFQKLVKFSLVQKILQKMLMFLIAFILHLNIKTNFFKL